MTDLKRKILSQIKPLEIFQKYIDVDVRFGKAIKSPLRHDRNPSFNIYRNENGNIYYKDFAGDRGDCFHFVMKLFDVDFKTALDIVAKDFNIMDIEGLEVPERKTFIIPKINIRKRKEVEMLAKPWNSLSIIYWEQFNITEKILREYDVKYLEWFVIGGFRVKGSLSDPIFCYDYKNGGYKFYRPLTKQRKWKFLSNTFATDIFGLNQLQPKESKIIICAGQKDVMSLYANTGIRGICLNSEKNLYHEDLHIKLTGISQNILVCYDRDDTGTEAMNKIANDYNITKVDLNMLNFKGKDIADYFSDPETKTEDFTNYINIITNADND